MSGIKVLDEETGEWKEIGGFELRPTWRSPSEDSSAAGEDGDGNQIKGRRYSVVVWFPIDPDEDRMLNMRIHDEMVKAIGNCLVDAGKISSEDVR